MDGRRSDRSKIRSDRYLGGREEMCGLCSFMCVCAVGNEWATSPSHGMQSGDWDGDPNNVSCLLLQLLLSLPSHLSFTPITTQPHTTQHTLRSLISPTASSFRTHPPS